MQAGDGDPANGPHLRRLAGAQPRRAAAGAQARPARSPAPRPAPRTRRGCSRAGTRPPCRWPCARGRTHVGPCAQLAVVIQVQSTPLLLSSVSDSAECSRIGLRQVQQRLCASEDRALSARRSRRGRARGGEPADRCGDVPDVVQVHHGRAEAVRAGGGARLRAAVQARVRVVNGWAQDLAQRDRGRKRAELLRAGGRRAGAARGAPVRWRRTRRRAPQGTHVRAGRGRPHQDEAQGPDMQHWQ